jgi:hypothetical protein
MKYTRRNKKRSTTRKRKQRGGMPSWYPQVVDEARTIQQTAHSMDDTNRPFLIAGSTAVLIYLYELLTTDRGYLTQEEYNKGIELLRSLKKPDDLDFKYKRQYTLFHDHIHKNASNNKPNKSTNKLQLDLSQFTAKTVNITTCPQYVDLAGFRCCDTWEENPIFEPLPDTVSIFSKIEFNYPREFRRKPMHTANIGKLALLGIKDVYILYDNHTAAGNIDIHKIAALEFIIDIISNIPELSTKYIGE